MKKAILWALERTSRPADTTIGLPPAGAAQRKAINEVGF
jgi:hypothetical protein